MYQLRIEDYLICENGNIINKRSGRILKTDPNAKGYLRVHIGGKKHFVHKLVAEKYVPNPFNKPQVNHINGIKTDNRAENLEWVTNQENRHHAVMNGLQLCGEKCNFSKLKEKDVIFIRNNKNLSFEEMAKMFNVTIGTIKSIINYETWKHLKS